MDGFNRRAFVKASAAAGAMSSVKAFSVAKPTANDTELKVAVVGCGGRGTGAAVQALNVRKGIKVVAMADAFKDRLEKSLNAIKQEFEGEKKIEVKEKNMLVGFNGYKKAIDLIIH